jgi:hypothetical protein
LSFFTSSSLSICFLLLDSFFSFLLSTLFEFPSRLLFLVCWSRDPPWLVCGLDLALWFTTGEESWVLLWRRLDLSASWALECRLSTAGSLKVQERALMVHMYTLKMGNAVIMMLDLRQEYLIKNLRQNGILRGLQSASELYQLSDQWNMLQNSEQYNLEVFFL